jgi:hypothetical protein
MPGRNGQGGSIAVLIGRDGYLKVARRDPEFVDIDADVIYENDEYRVTRKADGTRTVEHSYGNPAQRGDAVGAYAVLRRDGKPDRYFYAPLAQYAKDTQKSAWRYRDAMIVKCAISYIARTTYGVSGAVPIDEVNGGLALPGDGGVIDTTAADAPPALPEGLSMLVARAYAVDPRSWRPNEVLARLPEPGDRGFDAAVKKVMAELEAWLAENEPQDAVVVEDAPRFRDRNGDGTVDVAAELQHRWDVDPDWRAKVNPLLRRYVDAEAGLEEAIADDRGEDAASLRETLAEIAQELLALGVPEGWLPEAAGQS